MFQPFLPPVPAAIPTRTDFRVGGKRAALILIHGFSGNTRSTWSGLIDFILRDAHILTWDVYGIGFPSSLRIDVPEVWAADPDLTMIAQQLRTTLSLEPFRNYEVLSFAAHSMGGLVLQRAILDDEPLAGRLGHVFLFGTPSGGLPKARLVSRIKRQFRDMSPGSPFILALRRDWQFKYGSNVPFELRVIAGDRDEFVPSSSSLIPFSAAHQSAVPGNHLEIVKPVSAGHQSVRIIVEGLTGGGRAMPPIDSARLAVELGQFKRAVTTLRPQASQLDDNAIISLALALEGIGKGDEALRVIESHCKGGRISSSEAFGTLAGRLKRRWLAARSAHDFIRAVEMYEEGLKRAEATEDFDQAYYHAINLAFLKLMELPPFSAVSEECSGMARRALAFCGRCRESQWRLASEGEALLLLGQLHEGLEKYRQAIARTGSQREIDSMYSQAFRIAERVYGENGLMQIEQTFGLHR